MASFVVKAARVVVDSGQTQLRTVIKDALINFDSVSAGLRATPLFSPRITLGISIVYVLDFSFHLYMERNSAPIKLLKICF